MGSSGSTSCFGKPACSGYTTTRYDSNVLAIPHFQIRCGNETYFGPNLYFFAPSGKEEVNDNSPICHENDDTVHPKYSLIGYFPKGACSSLEFATYEAAYCDVGSLSSKVSSESQLLQLLPPFSI